MFGLSLPEMLILGALAFVAIIIVVVRQLKRK